MTRLVWGATGERFFEAGADRGVLFLTGQEGVPWNGLKSVSESPEGGEPQPYYVDGYKYINVAAAEDYKATLSAFSAPREFGVCDGTASIHNGLFATQQPRKTFSLSYRTLVGNDILGVDHGYKIHLVYNALAAPSTRENTTLSGTPTPITLSWSITTTPPKITGLRPTAHFVIDSRYTPPNLMKAIEDILYGTTSESSRLPTVSELITLFNSPGPIIRRNSVSTPRPKGTFVASGWAAASGLGTVPEPGWIGGTLISTTTPYIFTGKSDQAYAVGDKVTLLVKYRMTGSGGAANWVTVMPHIRSTNAYYRGGYQVTRPIVIGQEEFVAIEWITPIAIVAGDLDIALAGAGSAAGAGLSSADAGWGIRATEALIEPGWKGKTFFDGDTLDTTTVQYDWLAGVGISPSTMRSWF